MTTALTERIKTAWAAKPETYSFDELLGTAITECAAYFMPRAWTVEELRALPIGTLVADADGTTWVQTHYGFQLHVAGGQTHQTYLTDVLASYAPQHITHLPKDNP